jgi:hypothetical protein
MAGIPKGSCGLRSDGGKMITTHKVIELKIEKGLVYDDNDGVKCPLSSYLDRKAAGGLLLVSLCFKSEDTYLVIFRTE